MYKMESKMMNLDYTKISDSETDSGLGHSQYVSDENETNDTSIRNKKHSQYVTNEYDIGTDTSIRNKKHSLCISDDSDSENEIQIRHRKNKCTKCNDNEEQIKELEQILAFKDLKIKKLDKKYIKIRESYEDSVEKLTNHNEQIDSMKVKYEGLKEKYTEISSEIVKIKLENTKLRLENKNYRTNQRIYERKKENINANEETDVSKLQNNGIYNDESTLSSILKDFQKSIEISQINAKVMYNEKVEKIQKEIKDVIANSDTHLKKETVNTKVTAQLLRARNGVGIHPLTSYINEIEMFHENERKSMFVATAECSIITILGGLENIQTLTFQEIKSQLYQLVTNVDPVERLIELRKYEWKGDVEPLVFKLKLKNEYDKISNIKKPEIEFDEILTMNITSRIRQDKKEIFKKLLKNDIDGTIKSMCRLFNEKGRNYYFDADNEYVTNNERYTENVTEKCKENSMNVDVQSGFNRNKRLVIFGLKNYGDDQKSMQNLLEEFNLNIGVKKIFRINSRTNEKPLNVEFNNLSDRNIFFKEYFSRKILQLC